MTIGIYLLVQEILKYLNTFPQIDQVSTLSGLQPNRIDKNKIDIRNFFIYIV